MASKQLQSAAPVCVSQKVDVELTPLEFRLLESAHYLDTEALKKAKHTKIEIGSVAADCCRKLVYAVVQKGMVTALEFEDEADVSRAATSPGLAKLIETALEETGNKSAASKKLPVAFGDLLLAPGGIVIEHWTCFKICMFGFCLICCYGNDKGGPFTTCTFS